MPEFASRIEGRRLEAAVRYLAETVGERNHYRPERYAQAQAFLEKSLAEYGYEVRRESYQVGSQVAVNLVVERPGSEEIVIIGAHYDSVPGTPGADDNATGVAACLELARVFARRNTEKTLRFVFFANEEPPYFQTESMGSLVYARGCRERGEKVVSMLALESLGYFSDEAGSQEFPAGITGYPRVGNFIAFVSNFGSRSLLREMTTAFQSVSEVPSEVLSAPDFVPGVGFSDHWSFWQCGYPAVMITDTVPFRNPHYHLPSDTPDTLDFSRFTGVVEGLEYLVFKQAGCNTLGRESA
jgi:Zn-dependent M28 family amino/carboxypeptidase